MANHGNCKECGITTTWLSKEGFCVKCHLIVNSESTKQVSSWWTEAPIAERATRLVKLNHRREVSRRLLAPCNICDDDVIGGHEIYSATTWGYEIVAHVPCADRHAIKDEPKPQPVVVIESAPGDKMDEILRRLASLETQMDRLYKRVDFAVYGIKDIMIEFNIEAGKHRGEHVPTSAERTGGQQWTPPRPNRTYT